MKKVNKAKVEKVVNPEHGLGGEEGVGNLEHGHGNDAAHQQGEQGPIVEQRGILTKGKQVSTVPGKQCPKREAYLKFPYKNKNFFQCRVPRGEREFLSFSQVLQDENENFSLSILCLETRTKIYSFNLGLRDKNENRD